MEGMGKSGKVEWGKTVSTFQADMRVRPVCVCVCLCLRVGE